MRKWKRIKALLIKTKKTNWTYWDQREGRGLGLLGGTRTESLQDQKIDGLNLPPLLGRIETGDPDLLRVGSQQKDQNLQIKKEAEIVLLPQSASKDNPDSILRRWNFPLRLLLPLLNQGTSPIRNDYSPATSSKMDKYFASDYDPALDVEFSDQVDPSTGLLRTDGEGGWDNMLEVIRQREKDAIMEKEKAREQKKEIRRKEKEKERRDRKDREKDRKEVI